MIRRPPSSTRTYTLFPYTTLFRSMQTHVGGVVVAPRLGCPIQGEMFYAGHECVIRSQVVALIAVHHRLGNRSEEHTSELQSLIRISYAVFCLKKKKKKQLNNKKIKHR